MIASHALPSFVDVEHLHKVGSSQTCPSRKVENPLSRDAWRLAPWIFLRARSNDAHHLSILDAKERWVVHGCDVQSVCIHLVPQQSKKARDIEMGEMSAAAAVSYCSGHYTSSSPSRAPSAPPACRPWTFAPRFPSRREASTPRANKR